MKQVVRKGISEMEVVEVPEPFAPSGHVLIRPRFSLISSGTETADIHAGGVLKSVQDNPSHIQTVLNVAKKMGPLRTYTEVKAKFSDLAALGYSGAGVVVDKHPSVDDLEIGERVAYGGEGTGHAETIVTGRLLTARVPENVSFDHASFATLGAIAMSAVRTSGIGLGDRVAVIGLGLVGQLIVQLARLQGAQVIGSDLLPERMDLARQLGADHAIAGGEGLVESVAAVTDGHGADCVFIAAAAKKSSAPAQAALSICRDRGKIVVVGAVQMEFPWAEMYIKEIQLLMSRAYGPGSYDPSYEKKAIDYPFSYIRWTENRNMEEFLRLIGRGALQIAPLISHRFPLDEAPKGYATIMDPAAKSLAVVLRYPAADEDDAGKTASREPVRRVATSSKPVDKEKLGTAVVGAGNLAKWEHLPILQKLSDLRAVHSSSGVRGKSYAQRFGANYCTTDYDEILNDPDVDVVLIASRNQLHASQTIAALKAGKHVFVEKPMALTMEECREIHEAAQQAGRHVSVGFNRRFSTFYTPLKEKLIKRSAPAVVNCRVNSPGISGDYWMADPKIGGAILGEACHFVDLMFWLLDSEPVRVSAYTLPTDVKEPIGMNNLAASFQFADGSVGSLTYCTMGSDTSGGERVEVFAQGLGATTEDFQRVTISGKTQTSKSKYFAEKGYEAQLESFLRRIKNGQAPVVTHIDGARATIGCLAMLESAKTFASVEIESL